MIDLTEWEKRFALSVQNTELLGDIELTENEFMDLQQKLKDYIKEHGYVYLNSRAPLSLAVFLVRIGIKEYNEGNYWSAVQKALEIPGNDPRWQGIFGNSFLKTLDYYNLAKFYAPGLKYVTPILIHGRIPDNYLENFFDVILDLFADNFEDNLSKEYIKNTVRLWREDHFGRLETQRELDDTKEKLKKVNEELAKYENIKKHWSLYEKAKEISENIFDTDELSSLLELPENFMENTIAEIEKLKQELYEKRSLLKPVKDYLAERSEHNTNLSAKQLALNKITGDIELFTGKLKVPITDILGKEILALPFHKLEAAYEKYASLSKDNIIKLFILKIFQKLFGKKSKEEIYISEIKELVANIPFKEDVLKDIHEVYNTIKNLRNLFNEYFSYKEEVEKLEIILEQLEVSFLEIAAGEALSNLLVNGNNFTLKLEEEINSQVHKLNVLEKNLIDYKTNLVALGKGVLAKGKEILAEQRNYRKYLSQISGKIKTEIPTEIFETIQDINMLNNQIEELKMNKNELSEYIMATEKKIKSYPEPLLYNLNESAKKFIYFGESIAEDFVYETANMLKKLLYEEDIKQVKLPSHIQESAKEWIIKLKEEIGKIEKFENAQQEHLFRTPAIYYDSDLKEIKLSIPEQRLSKTLLFEDKIVIKIYKGDFQDLLKQEELRLYSKDGCLLTEEATINLIESAKNYTVVLECGNSNIETWIIPMMNEDIPFSYWDITNHNFWVKYANKFSGKRLNDCLLSNLSDITSRLRESYNISFATKLVLRLIFIRYLIDRGVDLDYAGFSYDVSSSRASLLKILKNKKELYALFSHLKDKFNGNLFEFDNEIFDASLTADALQLLYEFLSANINTKTGQLSFFDMYDFNIIPVELISNIYEILLGSEKRNRYNAFYTPQYLVNYILDASVSPFVRDYGSCKVLDPACGSGIFLVESYRRMVEKELRGDQFTEDNELLQRLLVENIFGIDLNEEAIDVTIFSLYLAMLDYKNPKTLKKFNLPNLKGSNLLVNDFFDKVVLARLRTMDFDFIIGNPPWGKGNELQANYCKENGYSSLMQNNDTCRGFILRSKDFCNNNTQCCFVLHSTMLYMQNQPSKNLRRYLLKNTEIIRIIELSSVRKLIFKNADAPAVVLSFKFDNRNVQKNRFEYISIKPNIFFRLFGIIVVERNDIKQVEQRLLIENDWVWKTLVYGLTGDIDTILKLKQKFPSVKQAIKEQNPELLLGAGVEPQKGDRNDSKHLIGRPFLSSNSIEHFYIDEQNIGSN
jgi:hypothetical protein